MGESFLGRGWAFPPRFDVATGTVEMVEDDDDIRQSLEILLSTDLGERILEPRYGCDLRRYIFEPLDATVKAQIKELVRTSILYFEPRIIVDAIALHTTAEEGRLDIELTYHVPTTNSRQNLVFPFYLSQSEGGAA